MKKLGVVCVGAVLVAVVLGIVRVEARHEDRTLAIVMSNDMAANAIKVYDAETMVLLQTLPTRGKGGVGGNARGVKQVDGDLVAAVNYGSNNVTVFRRTGDRLAFERLLPTTSAPVSVDFGNDHMYVAGATTVDSFPLRHRTVGWMDGTTGLLLAEGGAPPAGSTAQVGVISGRRLLVTLKTDPTPGTVDVVALRDGAVSNAAPVAVSAPAGTLTPFGFSVFSDGTALITLAHSNHDGLFRDGAFVATVDSIEMAPCWSTRIGKYVFTANTASRTLSRLEGSGSHLFIDSQVAATIPTGSPTDLDGDNGVLAVLDHGAGQSHLTFFRYNRFGELTVRGPAVSLAPTANGVAIMAPSSNYEG